MNSRLTSWLIRLPHTRILLLKLTSFDLMQGIRRITSLLVVISSSLKKEDTTTNDTRMNFKIQHQEMNAHVISVEYALSPLQDAIISLRLSYYMGNQSMFSYNITLSSVVNLSSESSETIEVTPIKPKLSQKVLGENAVG